VKDVVGNLVGIALYPIKYLRLNHGEYKGKIHCIHHSMGNGDYSLRLQRNRRNLSNAIATDAISSIFRESSISYRRNSSRYPVAPISYRRFIHAFFIRPKLRLENPSIEPNYAVSAGRLARLVIYNAGRGSVDNLKVKIKVKETWTNSKTLKDSSAEEAMLKVISEDRIPITLAYVSKKGKACAILTFEDKSVTLDMGRSYELELQFVGDNFRDRRKWKLTLDLSSYDAFNLTLP